jgi:hypothetical protein
MDAWRNRLVKLLIVDEASLCLRVRFVVFICQIERGNEAHVSCELLSDIHQKQVGIVRSSKRL